MQQKKTRIFPRECNFQLRKIIKIPYPLVGVSGEDGGGRKKVVEKEDFFTWKNGRDFEGSTRCPRAPESEI